MLGKKVNAALLALILEGFLMRLSFGIISFTLPLYARHLGLSLTETGALIALTEVVKVALKPVTGWMADKVGLKRGFVTSLALRSLVSFLLAFTAAPWQLFSVRLLHGVSTAIRDPAMNSLVAEHGDEKSLGSSFAWLFTVKSLAGSMGNATAGALLTLTASQFPLVFLITWGISSLTIPVVLLMVPNSTPKPQAPQEAASQILTGANGNGSEAPDAQKSLRARVLSVMGLGFLISATNQMVHAFYPILATEYAGMTPAQAGAVFLASSVVTLVAGPLFGWMSDHIGRKPIVAARSIANAGSSLLYLLVPNATGFTAGKLLDDTGKAGFRPAWGALKADVSSANRRQRARIMGFLDMGDDSGDIAGTIAGGFLWSVWGIVGLMGTRIALAVFTEVYAALVTWRRYQGPTAKSQQMAILSAGTRASSEPLLEKDPPD